MKQKEIKKAFMLIANWKKPYVSMVYTKEYFRDKNVN